VNDILNKMNNQNETIIFTDGSSRGNPGRGGWAAIVIEDEKIQELGEGESETTNNRMELTAAIKGLQSVEATTVKIFSDSSYVINGITKWVFGWQNRNWQTSLKQEVLNRDLWEKLIQATRGRKIDWRYVGGHIGIPGNERCDEIATAFADGLKPKLFYGKYKDYPIKNLTDVTSGDVNSVQAAIKKQKREHSKATAYSYVSMIDGAIKIHKTWAECEARVRGKGGAKYRKVLSKEEESSLIREWNAL
jgi:ribonuclease HI